MSLPHRIHLLRHGQSKGNVDRTIYSHTPDHAVPLTDLGREQAVEVGRKLREDLRPQPDPWLGAARMVQPSLGVYLSPYLRTKQTWAAMADQFTGTLQPRFVREDVRLREQEWSACPAAAAANNKAATWEEAERYGEFWYRHPSGESCADALDRAYGFWERFRRDIEQADRRDGWIDMPTDVLIIGHGIQLRLLLIAQLGWTVDQFYAVGSPPNCGRYVLELAPGGRYDLATELPTRITAAAAAA